MENLHLRLKDLRKQSGMSLKEVGDKVGLSKTHIWELEQGITANPSLKSSLALANLYGTSLDSLAGVVSTCDPVGYDD